MPAAKPPPSVPLSSLVEGILAGVARAASSVNSATAELAPTYAKNEVLRVLGIPTLEITEVTATLRCAAVGVTSDKKGARDVSVIVDPSALAGIDATKLQEIQLKITGRARPVVDLPAGREGQKQTLG